MKNKKHSSSKIEDEKQSPMGIDFDALTKRLQEDDSFISSIIDTIPPKLYFDQDVQEKIKAQKHLAMDQAATALKRGSVELSSRGKHKRSRLDPSQYKPVSEIQKEQKQSKSRKNAAFLSASLTRAANIEELQKRLQERIKELRGKRKNVTETESRETKRLKTKVKRLKKQNRGNLNKILGTTDTTPVVKTETKTNLKPKPIYNKEGKIIYSKFDFTDSAEKVKEGRKKKKKLTGKNYKNLLQEVEKETEKIENVKQKDPSKANSLIEKKAWEKAIMKAEGVKIKDDPAKLKKALKKQEKKKMHSSKEWQKRKENTEKQIKEKQEKRKKNIQNRKKEKLNNKIKRAKKRGRIVPGF